MTGALVEGLSTHTRRLEILSPTLGETEMLGLLSTLDRGLETELEGALLSI